MNLNKLINKGMLTVYLPILLFVVTCGYIANWYAKNILYSEMADFIVIATLIIAICIGWIWWSFKIVKWKYWAFSQLNKEESYVLYEKAIKIGLLWPKGNIFNKTEIWLKKDKKKWLTINQEIRELFD